MGIDDDLVDHAIANSPYDPGEAPHRLDLQGAVVEPADQPARVAALGVDLVAGPDAAFHVEHARQDLDDAIAGGADYVLIPENPPAEGWEDQMCELLRNGRAAGRRDSIVVVAEGAQFHPPAPTG